MERWDRTLAQGIHSDHFCTAMFEELIVGSVSKFGNSRIEFGMGSRKLCGVLPMPIASFR